MCGLNRANGVSAGIPAQLGWKTCACGAGGVRGCKCLSEALGGWRKWDGLGPQFQTRRLTRRTEQGPWASLVTCTPDNMGGVWPEGGVALSPSTTWLGDGKSDLGFGDEGGFVGLGAGHVRLGQHGPSQPPGDVVGCSTGGVAHVGTRGGKGTMQLGFGRGDCEACGPAWQTLGC